MWRLRCVVSVTIQEDRCGAKQPRRVCCEQRSRFRRRTELCAELCLEDNPATHTHKQLTLSRTIESLSPTVALRDLLTRDYVGAEQARSDDDQENQRRDWRIVRGLDGGVFGGAHLIYMYMLCAHFENTFEPCWTLIQRETGQR